MRQHAGMPLFGEADMLIHLVAQNIYFTFGDGLPQRSKIGFLPHRRRRIMRRIQDHQTGFVTQQRSKCLPVRAKMRWLERHALHHAAGQFNRRGVAIVARVKTNHLITRTHQGGYRRIQRFGRPCRHRDIAVRVRLMAV